MISTLIMKLEFLFCTVFRTDKSTHPSVYQYLKDSKCTSSTGKEYNFFSD